MSDLFTFFFNCRYCVSWYQSQVGNQGFDIITQPDERYLHSFFNHRYCVSWYQSQVGNQGFDIITQPDEQWKCITMEKLVGNNYNYWKLCMEL